MSGWGEVRLRRIVEAAGMLEHVDFGEQLSDTRADGNAGQRPDLVVHLSGDRHVVIDAKAPLDFPLGITPSGQCDRIKVGTGRDRRALLSFRDTCQLASRTCRRSVRRVNHCDAR